jgi:hypothetical protein
MSSAEDANWFLWFTALCHLEPMSPTVQKTDIYLIARAKEYAITYNRLVASLGHVTTTEKDYEPRQQPSIDGWVNLLPFLPQRAFFVLGTDGSFMSVIDNAKKMATVINSFPARIRHIL